MSAAKAKAAAPAPEPDCCGNCACFAPAKPSAEAAAQAAALGVDIGRGFCFEGPQTFRKSPGEWCGRHRRKETRRGE